MKKFINKLEEEMESGNIPKCIGVDTLEHTKNLMGNCYQERVNVGLNYMNVGVENGVNKILH